MLVRLYLREVDSPAVEVTPAISAARLEAARGYAAFGAETPLLLLDDTNGGAGDEGGLLTTAAFYLSKPHMRIPLELVTDVPKHPEGPRRPGVLESSAGAIPMPQFKLAAVREALHRAINAISAFNRGHTDLVLPAVPLSETPLGELVRKHLVHREIAFGADLSPLAQRTIALATEPLDVLAGEQLFALVDESNGKATEGVVLTDRRLLYRRQAERLSIPYAPLQQAWADVSPLGSKLEILVDGQRTALVLGKRQRTLPHLAAFLDEIAQTIAPTERSAPMVLKRSNADPAGLGSAAALLGPHEPRTAALCALLSSALRSESLPADVVWDLVNRTLLLHHGLTVGRSMHEGWWLSPLTAADALYLMRSLLGRPYREGAVGEGHGLDLAFDARRAGEWIKAIASGTVGQAVGAVFGAGWGRAPLPAVTALRVEVHPLGPRGLFCVTAMLEGRPLGLDEVAGPAFVGFDRQLAELEARVLLVRVLLGWGLQAQELMQTPTPALCARLEAMGGDPGMLALFGMG
jgi:hypothetical protein